MSAQSDYKFIADTSLKCPFCPSTNVVKHGKRYNYKAKTVVQRYLCKECGSDYKAGGSPSGYKAPSEVIAYACGEVKKGYSSREVALDVQRTFDFKVSHATITKWAKHFANHSYPRLAPKLATSKIIHTVLDRVSYEEISQLSGVSYNTVKCFFWRALNRKPNKNSRRMLMAKIKALESRLDTIHQELQSMRVP